MAFTIYQDDIFTSPQVEYVEATAAEKYEVGELLKMAAGKATKASGTDVPTHVCNCRKIAAEGDQVQVIRLHKTHRLKTTLSAEGASLNSGDKVTIHTDGLQATATTEGGVLEIVQVIDSAVGGEIVVRI